MTRLRSCDGFTIVELLIVIIVIGALVSIAVPNYSKMIDRAKAVACKANIRTIEIARVFNSVNYGSFGSNLSELKPMFEEIGFIDKNDESSLVCPDGGVYIYETATYNVTCSIIEHNR